MSCNAVCENKILTKISGFTVFHLYIPCWKSFSKYTNLYDLDLSPTCDKIIQFNCDESIAYIANTMDPDQTALVFILLAFIDKLVWSAFEYMQQML